MYIEIGIYEGNKENRDCIERIFSNLINDIQDACEDIRSLLLRSQNNISQQCVNLYGTTPE